MASRRKFIKDTLTGSGALTVALFPPFYIKPSKPMLSEEILGHGDFRYRLETGWGDLDPNRYPLNNCHEMVRDNLGRLFMLTDHPRNNMLIYDPSGKLLDHWTVSLQGAHGLSIAEEGETEFLYITDPGLGRVLKCTLKGEIVMKLEHPTKMGAYEEHAPYRPTETAVGPNGDIYVADGFGSQFILQYDAHGNFIRKFGGDSFLQPDKFKQAHDVCLDRDKNLYVCQWNAGGVYPYKLHRV